MENDNTHQELIVLLKQNNQLLTENNEILKKMRRASRIGFIFRLLWIAVIIGGPLFLYWYFIEPMMSSFMPSAEGASSLFDQIKTYETYFKQFQP